MNRALLVALVLLTAVPLVAAEPFRGSLAAEQMFLQGGTTTSSPSLKANIGGDGHSFENSLGITLTAKTVIVEQFSQGTIGVAPVCQKCMDPSRSKSPPPATYTDSVVVFDSWLPADAQLVVETEDGATATTARLDGFATAPTPLTTLAADQTWAIDPPKGAQVGFPQDFSFKAPAGNLVLTGPEFARHLTIQGDFSVFVFGAMLRVGQDTYPSGMRKEETPPPMERGWLNVTTLHVHQGMLSLDPGTNPITAYVPSADFAGTGALLLRGATGHLQESKGRAVSLQNQDMDLVGNYAVSVRGAAKGLLATVDGDFNADLVPFSTTTAPRASNWWWLALGVGLVAVAGGGTVVAVNRRKTAPPAQVLAPIPVAATPLEVPEAAHMDADFGWDAINEEFGVVRAGEKAGVLIVLVPEDKVQNFLAAVVQRGLMAEDTGDRVHAGDNTLAVIALEPSPLMMN